jgi:hypothetical protein
MGLERPEQEAGGVDLDLMAPFSLKVRSRPSRRREQLEKETCRCPLTSRRTLVTLTMAATLTLASPAVARSLPTPNLEASRSPVQQLLQGAVGWVHSLLAPLWDETGSGLDPDGAPTTDTGSGLDPSGSQTDDDTGSGLDPNGRT